MAVLNEMQSMVLDTAQDWTRERLSLSAFRAMRNARPSQGYDAASWQEAAELGWVSTAISEDQGGAGLGYLTLGLIVEQIGRNIGALPLSATAVATDAVVQAGSDGLKAHWLERLLTGAAVGTVALDEGARHVPEKVATTATATADGWIIDGTKQFVVEGKSADLLIISATTNDGIALFAIDASKDGITRTERYLADARGHADVAFNKVAVDVSARLSFANGDDALITALLHRLRALAAAELLGIAASAFDITLDYLKTRVQFGQTIGSFQALQHRAAELFTRIELTRSAVEAALMAIDTNAASVDTLVNLAKASAGDTANLATREMIQLHGGIGMTDEHDAGFFIKRSRVLENQWGTAAYHRQSYAKALGL